MGNGYFKPPQAKFQDDVGGRRGGESRQAIGVVAG
jgi:hypothetical protein